MFEYNIKFILSFVVALHFYVVYVDSCSTSTSTQSPADSILFLGKGATGAVYTKSNSHEYAFKLFFGAVNVGDLVVNNLKDAQQYRDENRVCLAYESVNLTENEKTSVEQVFNATVSNVVLRIVRADPQMVTLESYIKDKHLQSESFYLSVLKDVCKGLSFMQLHRRYWGDLKSNNVMVHPTTHRAVLIGLDTFPKIQDDVTELPKCMHGLGLMILNIIGVKLSTIPDVDCDKAGAKVEQEQLYESIEESSSKSELFRLKYLGLAALRSGDDDDKKLKLAEVLEFLKKFENHDALVLYELVNRVAKSTTSKSWGLKPLTVKVKVKPSSAPTDLPKASKDLSEASEAPSEETIDMFSCILEAFLNLYWPLFIDPNINNIEVAALLSRSSQEIKEKIKEKIKGKITDSAQLKKDLSKEIECTSDSDDKLNKGYRDKVNEILPSIWKNLALLK